MPVSFSDKVEIFWHVCGFNDVDRCREYYGLIGRDEGGLKNLIRSKERYKNKNKYSGGNGSKKSEFVDICRHGIIVYLKEKCIFVDDVYKFVHNILNEDVSIFSLMKYLKLSWSEIEALEISSVLREEMNERFMDLHFLRLIGEKNSSEIAASYLEKVRGDYVMYRKHSVYPGMVEEYISIHNITSHGSGGEGIYYQLNMNSPNDRQEVPINVFHAGFYIFIVGAIDRSREEISEILTISVLTGDVVGNGYVGILNGIYDHNKSLLAERVYLEKAHIVPIVSPKEGEVKHHPKYIVPDECLQDVRFRRISAVISNELDGNTLSARQSRTEIMNL